MNLIKLEKGIILRDKINILKQKLNLLKDSSKFDSFKVGTENAWLTSITLSIDEIEFIKSKRIKEIEEEIKLLDHQFKIL